jgi:hypothetical protein
MLAALPRIFMMPRRLGHGRIRDVIVTVAVATVVVGGAAFIPNLPSGSTPAPSGTANLWLAPTASNNCTGGRSSTPVDYTTAVSQSRVCTTWSRACTAASGGDTVLVKAGTYNEETPAAAATYIEGDCSKGLGNDVDPTALAPGTTPVAAISNWVTFSCGDGETRDTVILNFKYFSPHGNNHMYVKGNCFLFGTIEYGIGSESGVTTQNAIFDGIHTQGFQINGARNVWLTNMELGPVVMCYQDGVGVESQQCDATGSAIGFMEHRWANRGNGSSDLQTQGRVNPNNGTSSENVLIENVWWHDSQSKESIDLHTGCGFVLDNASAATDNVIYRNVVCERVVHQGMYISDSSGVTMENWQMTCPVEPLDNVGESNWGTANCNQRAFHVNCASPCSNILYRYNSSVSAVDWISNTDVGTNVRSVGNIANTHNCPSDVTGDYNVRSTAGAACGTNGATYSGSAPFVDTDFGTSPTTSTAVNLHLAGSSGTYGFEDDVTPTSTDYALTIDMDGATRTSGSRDPGADER